MSKHPFTRQRPKNGDMGGKVGLVCRAKFLAQGTSFLIIILPFFTPQHKEHLIIKCYKKSISARHHLASAMPQEI